MTILNGDFETTFAGWQTIGDTSIENAEFGIDPTQGEFQALLTNGFRDSGGSVVDSDLEEFLNLTPGILDDLGNRDVTEGSAIKQTFTANAGDTLTFDWNFLTNEATPNLSYNDFAFFSIADLPTKLADTTFSSFIETSARDFSEETGYQTSSIIIPESGTFTLSFGVVDVGDDVFDSALLVDNIQISAFEPNDTIFEATSTGLSGGQEGFYSVFTQIGNNPNVSPENDVDLFELSLDVGDQLIADINAETIGSELDSVLSVFDSQGLVEQNDNNFDSLDSFINFTAEFSDTYYVGVSSSNNIDYDPLIEGSGTGGLSSGSYELLLSIIPSEPRRVEI